MSIASAIQLKQQQVADAYTAVSTKGGTLPATQNLTNLPDAILSITTSIEPTLITKTFTGNGTYNASTYEADGFSQVVIDVPGSTLITKNITENGTYYAVSDGADGFSMVDVNIPIQPYIPREVSNSGVYQMPTVSFTYFSPAGVTDLGEGVLRYALCGSTGITGASFVGVTNITGDYALQMAFANCINLTAVSFPDLAVNFFGSNTNQNQFNDMLAGVTGCEVHFPSELEDVIGSWSDVVAGFGGTDTSVLFDIEPIPESEGE